MDYFRIISLVLLAGLVLLAAASVRMVIAEIRSRVATISRIEAKLDLLLKEAKVHFDA